MTTFPASMDIPLICPMKIDATASYNAVPSMLIVAPIGTTNLVILGSTLFLFSRHSIVIGSVAELYKNNEKVIPIRFNIKMLNLSLG